MNITKIAISHLTMLAHTLSKVSKKFPHIAGGISYTLACRIFRNDVKSKYLV